MSPSITKGSGKVLIMDDEDYIRDLFGEVLKQLGYEPTVSRHGEEALEFYKAATAAGKPFDVVILDLTVSGGLGGLDTLKELLAINPAVKAIAASGQVSDSLVSDLQRKGFCGVLSKPCRIAEIAQTLQRVIKGDAATG